MPTEAIQNLASARQLGEEQTGANDQMSSVNASRIISKLITKTQKNGIPNCKPKHVRINEPRLGMAMKEYLGKTERIVY